MQIITIAQLKGGCGKSTTAAALAQAATSAGKKVLAVDLDPQGNLSFFIGADQGKPGSLELLNGAPAKEIIQATEQGIDAIAARQDLATIKTASASARRLYRALQPVKESYDLIIIDTPASLGELHYNALQVSTGLITPQEADINNLQGFYRLIDIAGQMKESNPALSIMGAIVTRYDNRPKLNRYLRDAIRDRANEKQVPYLMEIRQGTAIREAQSFQLSLYKYAPRSAPAVDYMELYKLITKGE